MADNLKIGVDFASTGAPKVEQDMNKVTMSAKELERELKALAADYGKLEAQMYLLKQAGLENTAEFKLLSKTSEELKGKIGVLGDQYKQAGEKTKLFRERAVNLGADLTILSFGFKSVIGDVNDFRKEVSNTSPDVVKLGGSVASATISVLAMIPALKAMKEALGATGLSVTAATGFIGLFVAGLALMVNTVVDAVKGFEDFKKVLDGTLDVTKAMDDHIARLTFGLMGTSDASDIAAGSIFNLSQEMQRFIAIQQSFNPSTVTFGDIQKRFTDSNANFSDQYKKVLNGTANLTDANLVLTKLQERQKEVKGDDLKLINQTIDATNKYISTLQKVGLPERTKTSSNRTKKVEEETEAVKNLAIEYKKNAMAFIALQNVVDINTFNALTLSDFPAVLQQRFTEIEGQAQAIKQIFSDLANSVVSSMATLFGSLVPPQEALSPFQQLMKSILLSAINAAEGLLQTGIVSSFIKAIFTAGISLPADLALQAAAFVALESAKGFLGGFKDGTPPVSRSGMALVGEQGAELIYMQKGMGVMNNVDTRAYMSRNQGNSDSGSSVYLSPEMAMFTKATRKANRDIRQQNKWKRF